jgi:hypothetical protein
MAGERTSHFPRRFSIIMVWSLTKRPRSIAILVSRSVKQQYRKVRQVGTVQGQKYAEEQTGVKTGVSHSRKLIYPKLISNKDRIHFATE